LAKEVITQEKETTSGAWVHELKRNWVFDQI